MAPGNLTHSRPPFYRDTRVIAILLQAAFAFAVVLAGWFLYSTLIANLTATSRSAASALSWNFLGQTAGFSIAEGPAFRPEESYFRAYLVGLSNTVRVGIAGIILATLLGVLAGIARVSNNWLLNRVALTYVEIIRSTPLLVQLLFLYFGVISALPAIENAAEIRNLGYLSNRGVFITWPFLTITGEPWLWWLGGAIVAGVVAIWLRRRQQEAAGLPGSGLLTGIAVFLLVALLGYAIVAFTAQLPDNLSYQLQRGERGVLYVDRNGNGRYDPSIDQTAAHVPVTIYDAAGVAMATEVTAANGDFRFAGLPREGTTLTWETPAPIFLSSPSRQGFNFRGGLGLTPEFVGLLLGLTIYTGAFIAEIVRAGINAVPKGQWEASRALGLSAPATLRMIVLPQALRVIIPPLTSQYLNLVKNSSLAIAIGFPDLFYVGRIIVNQSGAEIQVILMIMVTYLALSLITSAFMNWYNRRAAIIER
jgi:general L-amino acid transport system permease protein